MDRNTPKELERLQPHTEENAKIRVTRFTGLCKSCGECVMKCPVNAISWDTKKLGMLGEPAIMIDLDKCIGCETCERVCPDSAIKITNKRLSSEKWKTGILGAVVRSNARLPRAGNAPQEVRQDQGQDARRAPRALLPPLRRNPDREAL